MREFRAWDITNKEMIYDNLDLEISIVTKTMSYKSQRKRHIFMQFTGLYDIHGVKIYEGDRVKVPSEYCGDTWVKTWEGEVEWLSGEFIIQDAYNNLFEGINTPNLEVIGNICEDK